MVIPEIYDRKKEKKTILFKLNKLNLINILIKYN